jgi:hypothetical protein
LHVEVSASDGIEYVDVGGRAVHVGSGELIARLSQP